MDWLTKIFGVGEHLAEYFKQKQQLKQDLKLAQLKGKIDLAQAEAQRKIRVLESDNAWELEQIKNSGWKDEWVLVLLSIPLVLSFVPATVTYVEQGFKVLGTTPEWYRWLIMLIFTAIYGIRIWRRKDD